MLIFSTPDKKMHLREFMGRFKSNISENYQRILLATAVMVLVLLTSCPVKSSIRSFSGLPVNTEQTHTKKNHLIENGSENCAQNDVIDALVFQTVSSPSADFFPVFLALAFTIWCGCLFGKHQARSFHSRHKIAATVPIFLQYRKLII